MMKKTTRNLLAILAAIAILLPGTAAQAGQPREAWQQLREELPAVAPDDLWRYTADMLYLIENPVVREAFFPSGNQELTVEPARADDARLIRRIAQRHEGPEAVSIIQLWLDFQPQAFRVARNRKGRVVAFYCMCEARHLAPEIRVQDPVAAAWFRHLRGRPATDLVQTLFIRRWIGESAGEAPSAEQAACWLDVKRAYMELRPDLRRVYLTVIDLATYRPVAVQLGFEHVEEATITLDDRNYHTAMLDFGRGSVDGWITRLVGDELGIAETSILDREQRALKLAGERIPLTPLEYKLVDYLEGLDGATATRVQILDEVWGSFDSAGSSNVVDAVVKSLRRKMGPEATRIETVRGFGYRWRIL